MPLIVFEGIDGCGKTTQVHLLVDKLQQRGVAPLCLREPGGTGLGEKLRELLLDPGTKANPVAELFGYQMARAQIVSERLKPALAANEVVILDRFWYSTVAYQAYGLGLPVAKVRHAIDLAVDDVTADLALYLQIDPAVAAERRALERGEDRIEARGLSYLQKVATGYQRLVDKGDLTAVDASRTIKAIETDIWQRVEPLLT